MATFKVGQRVRINCPHSTWHGKEGTVTSAAEFDNLSSNGQVIKCWNHRVCVDGVGGRNKSGSDIAFRPQHLEPLTPPAEWTWDRVQALDGLPDWSIPLPHVVPPDVLREAVGA